MSTKLYIIDFEVNTLLSFPLPTLVVRFYVVALYNLNIGDGEVHIKIQLIGVGNGAILKRVWNCCLLAISVNNAKTVAKLLQIMWRPVSGRDRALGDNKMLPVKISIFK